MKFLADMGISPRLVAELRQKGYDAIHLQEQGLGKMRDSAILQKARDEARVLLTHDLDFGELLAASGKDLPSVVVFRLKDMRAPNIGLYLFSLLAHYSEAIEEGAICSVTEHRFRIRALPI